MDFDPLSQRMIGAAIRVHRELGPGFLESVYENAMKVELKAEGLLVESQVEVPIFYRDVSVGEHRLDLLVERTVVVELKAIQALDRVHFAVLRSYLKATHMQLGLLFNLERPPSSSSASRQNSTLNVLFLFFLAFWLSSQRRGPQDVSARATARRR